MIRPVAWPTVINALSWAPYNAKLSARAVVDGLADSIDRQAHASLCFELRDLAARIVMEVPRV